jgi:hypothetical protein
MSLRTIRWICFGICIFTMQSKIYAQAISGLSAVRVATGVGGVLFVAAPPGDTQRLFIVRKGGQIHILNLATGQLNATQFLNISARISTNNEQGLLGMAFDPSYATNGKFYLDFVVPGGTWGNGVTHVSQFQASASNPDIADASSEKILLTFSHPQTNHNGGWIGFSPRAGDGHNLYIATGDGGSANDQGTGHIEPGGNAQNNTTLLGKILRVHVNPSNGTISIPSDNPFFGSGTYRQEIWAFGLRNPWRNSFDPQTGRMFIGDVGQDSREEIDVQPSPVGSVAGVSALVTPTPTPALSGLTYNNGTPFVDGTQLVSGNTYTIVAQANAGTQRVEFKRNGEVVLTDNTIPFSFTWTLNGAAARTFAATPISSAGARGNPISVAFSVVVASPTPTPTPTATPTPTPTATPGAQNYEWRLREGTIATPAGGVGGARPPDGIDPIFDYPHTTGQCITGGYVYRGAQIPALRGTYVFGDYLGPEPGNVGRVFTFNYDGTRASNFQDITAQLFPTKIGNFTLKNPSSFGEDANHELYITDLGSGSVYKIVPATTSARINTIVTEPARN